MTKGYALLLLLLLLPATGCRHTYDCHVGFVPQILHERCCADVIADICLDDLLEQPLHVGAAVQIALFNNPKVQEILADVGIAHADLIKAGLWKNPVLLALIRFPDKAIYYNNVEYGIAASFLDICLSQLRRQVAAVEYSQVQLRVANAILDIVFDVEETFYSLQALERRRVLLGDLAELADISNELARRQAKKGNINDLTLSSATAKALKAQLELAQIDLQAVVLREKLNRLLGFASSGCWTLSTTAGDLPELQPDPCAIEELALETRLDVLAARWEFQKLCGIIAQNEAWAYTNLQIGVSHERDSEGITAFGPTLSMDLPIFNDGSAERTRLRTILLQSQSRLDALEIAVRSQVREALATLCVTRSLVSRYRDQLIPLQESMIATGTIFYNSMGYGVYALLDNKAQVIQSQIDASDAIRDYYLAHVALDRAVGGKLFMAIPSEMTSCNE